MGESLPFKSMSNRSRMNILLYVVVPEPEDTDPSVYTSVYFYIRDNVTNKDLTPLQKNFAERYDLSFSCAVNSVKDIIEQGDNIIYKCSGDYTDLAKANPRGKRSHLLFQRGRNL